MRFTFGLPTYNNENYIERCLTSIQRQDYDQSQVEVIIADGGSSDSTVRIARSFGVQVYPNRLRLADYGQQICARNSTGKYYVIWAADNELTDPYWLKKVESIMEGNGSVSALWGPMRSGPDDARVNKYYELIQSEPVTYFLNHNLQWYLKGARECSVFGAPCYIFKVDPKRPLVWGANGLVYRSEQIKPLLLRDKFVGDNDLFQGLIEAGRNTVAYMPSLSIEHHTVKSLTNWITKLVRKHVQHTISEIGGERNMNWLYTEKFGEQMAVWTIYSLIPTASTAQALHNALRDRNPYWFYHPILNFAQAAILVTTTLSSANGLRFLRKSLRRSPN